MTVPIATRSSWGARYDDGDLTLTGLALEVFAHHSVTAQLSPDASVEDERAQMRSIEATGHERFATPQAPNFGISYNVLIFPSGRAYQGVSWNRRGAHTDGRNSTVRSICFVGNYEEHEPTPAQVATASAIYHEGKGKWWVASAPLRGHRDLKATACPGKHVYAQLPAIAAGRTTQEDDMPTPEEIAKAVWDHKLPVPDELRKELGDEPKPARQLFASMLVRANRAEDLSRGGLLVDRQNRTKLDRVEDAVDDLKET